MCTVGTYMSTYIKAAQNFTWVSMGNDYNKLLYKDIGKNGT